MIQRNLPVLIPLVFLFASLVVSGFGIWKRQLAYPVALFATALAFGVALFGLQHVLTVGSISYRLGGWSPPIGIEYVLDPLAAFFTVVIVGIALLVLLHARIVVEHELPERSVAYYAVSMLFLTGLSGIIITGDLFNLYVFVEIASLSGYALVAVGEKQAPVAAFRYLLVGTIGASFYLLGLCFIYLESGSLNMADVAKILPALHSKPTVVVGVLLIVVGMGIKMALFPMHGWLPDAYTYAASTSSALLAPIGTKVAAYVLVRVLFFGFGVEYVRTELPIADVISWLSAAGIIFGSVMAMAQLEMKRMLAYSSIAQIGYVGLGIGLASPLGFIGAVLHVLNHALMKSCLFLVAANVRTSIGHSTIPSFDDSLRRQMPWTMAAFSVAALSMIGIPPMAGFFSKWYLALAGIEQSQWVFVAVILASSLLNAVYFFRVWERVYLRRPVEKHPVVHSESRIESREVRPSMLVPTTVLAIGILAMGLLNALVVELIIRKAIPPGL